MLVHLHVKNLALIQEVQADFGPGLNILTGETGAGKSILMGSVNLALGQKMSRGMIREGAPYALVELVFQVDAPTEEKLKEMEVFPEDGQVIITRRLMENRSISKVNGETTTAANIRKIASLLLDVHGQHEHQSLLYPEKQMEILEAIKMFSDMGLNSTGGLSNNSNGMPKHIRPIMDSAMVAMAMMQGLTSAIVNPNDKRLMETIKSCDVLKNNTLYADSYLEL